MHDLHILGDLVVVFAVAVIVVGLLQRFGLPGIAGMIFVGALVGPHGLALVDRSEEVEILAEIGVVVLLFGIGLEFSLERLRRLWKPIIIGGALQVVLTIAFAGGLADTLLGFEANAAFLIGMLTAVSSTAIVLRGLESRGEVDAPHGRLTVGILLFQDLSVVPMLLAVPLLAGQNGSAGGLVEALLRAAAVLVGTIVAARVVAPRLLDRVARSRQRDLFVLSLFLICVGTAWAVALAGLSLAIGAFLGGLVVADSEYRHQAMADLIPFREVFTSLFFVSIGMLLDVAVLIEHGPLVLGLVLAIILGKFVIVFAVGVIMRLPIPVSVRSGAALAQVGEFSFVVAFAARGTEILTEEAEELLSVAAIVTMFLAPLMLRLSPQLAAGVGRIRPLTRLLGVRTPEEVADKEPLGDHVVIAGYGVTGNELARSLREAKIPYVIVELNPENVREAASNGEPVYYGDVTSEEVLRHLDLERAAEFVVAINDPTAARRAVRAARHLAPNLHIVVRSRYVADRPRLNRAGADRVIPVEIEGAVQVTQYLLTRHGVEEAVVSSHIQRIRDSRELRSAGS